MKKLAYISLFALIVLTLGCTPVPLPAASVTPTSAPRPATLHLEVTTDPDLTDLPRLMAVDALKQQGYNIAPLYFDDPSLTTVAMQRGDLDIASLSNLSTWIAMQKGVAVVGIMDEAADLRLVAVTPSIQQCSDLNGKSIAINNLTSTPYAMLSDYISKNCPDAKPNYVVIANSNSRVASLLAGKIDGAVVDLFPFLIPAASGEVQIHELMSFHESYPNVINTGGFVRQDFAKQYPETVKDYIRATLLARRQLQDPQVFADELVKRFKLDPAEANKDAALYLQKKVWSLDGGYSPEVIQSMLDFFVKINALKPGQTPQDVTDLSYLNSILDEIGRK